MGSLSSTRTRNEWRPDGAYAMSGSVLEATTAGRGHQSGTEPLPRRSLAAWRIDTGHVNGVDVAGQVVVTVGDETPSKGGSHAILLDEAATPEQTLALVDAFSGRLGGPLADLVPVGDGHPGFSQVPLQYRLDGDVITSLDVELGDRVAEAVAVLRGDVEGPDHPAPVNWPAKGPP